VNDPARKAINVPDVAGVVPAGIPPSRCSAAIIGEALPGGCDG
jgi:hypothetical protein